MKGDGAENTGRDDEATRSIQKGGMPTRKVFVAGRNMGKTVMDRNFGGSQAKPEVRLRKGRHRGTEDVNKSSSGVSRDYNWKKRSFMVVDG